VLERLAVARLPATICGIVNRSIRGRNMIYELRTYTAAPGKMEALNRRFADHTLGLFRRHGIESIGYWVSKPNPDKLVYIVRFADEAAMKKAWDGFRADPDWQKVKSESEVGGVLAAKVESEVLSPTAYSMFLR